MDESDQAHKVEDECSRVQEVYKQCFSSLEMCFHQLLSKIYQIESETFKNYKFKDTVALFDTVLQESLRLNLYQLLPAMAQMISDQRIRTAAGLLRSHMIKIRQTALKKRFVQWRSTIGMKAFLSTTFRRAAVSKTICRVVRN